MVEPLVKRRDPTAEFAFALLVETADSVIVVVWSVTVPREHFGVAESLLVVGYRQLLSERRDSDIRKPGCVLQSMVRSLRCQQSRHELDGMEVNVLLFLEIHVTSLRALLAVVEASMSALAGAFRKKLERTKCARGQKSLWPAECSTTLLWPWVAGYGKTAVAGMACFALLWREVHERQAPRQNDATSLARAPPFHSLNCPAFITKYAAPEAVLTVQWLLPCRTAKSESESESESEPPLSHCTLLSLPL